jgi:CubicO group peptidase (beta-lactamase class C family)
MTSDFLGTSMAHAPIYLPGPGYGFGLGFTVRTAPGESANLGSVGDYGWGGIFGTLFFVDPKERLIGIYMIQQTDANAARSRFRTGVYSALE